MRRILIKEGSFLNFFDCVDADHEFQPVVGHKDQGKGTKRQFYQESKGGKQSQHLQPLQQMAMKDQNLDLQKMLINRQEFINKLDKHEFMMMPQDEAILVSEILYQGTTWISMQQLEDFALGFQQQAVKLFLLGKADSRLFSFYQKSQNLGADTKKEKDFNLDDESSQDSADSRYDSDNKSDEVESMAIVSRPTAVQFPKFSPQITQMACGQAHILALTQHEQMYSWGVGSYGALGFGSIEDVRQPTILDIMQGGMRLNIVKIVCGKMHSMCLSSKKKIFTWGTGLNGRLGHGHDEDVLVPTEIQMLSNLRVINISAGESHSAAITQTKKLYTWGNGSYGRLGTGFDVTQNKPVLVEDLAHKEMLKVSCGAFHTLVLSTEGYIYAFGQDKYGKLGLKSQEAEMKVRNTPVKVLPYVYEPSKSGNKKQLVFSNTLRFAQIVAGFNHSIALTRLGQVYTWGYNGYNLLGRKNQTTVPIQILTDLGGGPKNNYTVEVQKTQYQLYNLEDNIRNESVISTEVNDVQCGNLNTYVLTNGGEVYACGANRHGQLGNLKNSHHKKQNELKDQNSDELFQPVLFFNHQQYKVKHISCGGEHVFAVTRSEQVYGWGRNDSGQLGLGFIKDAVKEPVLVPSLEDKSIKSIECGEDYTMVITSLRKLLVTGALDGGKLGLGRAWRQGFVQEFKQIPQLNYVKSVACGPSHVIAICSANQTSGCSIYAWGKNWRGQLGTGNKDDQFSPKQLQLSKDERFAKVCCGRDFSIGLTKKTNKIYVWGNYRYQGIKESAAIDLEEPTITKFGYSKQFKDIYCSQTYCVALSDQNEMYVWGQFMKDMLKSQKQANAYSETKANFVLGMQGKDSESSSEGSSSSSSDSDDSESDDNDKSGAGKRGEAEDIYQISKFPIQYNRDIIRMSTIALGANHAASVGLMDRMLYCWGYNDCQQLGFQMDHYQQIKEFTDKQPVPVRSINDKLAVNIKKIEDGLINDVLPLDQQPLEEIEQKRQQQQNYEEQDIAPHLDQEQNLDVGQQEQYEESKEGRPRQIQGSQQPTQAVETEEIQIDIPNPQAQIKKTKDDLLIGATASQVPALSIGRNEEPSYEPYPVAEVMKPIMIVDNQDMSFEEKHYRLQSMLCQEKKGELDEKAMFERDKIINDSINRLMDRLSEIRPLEQERRKLKLQIKNSFLQRISEKPLAVPPGIDWPAYKLNPSLQEKMKRQKKLLQEVLVTLHVHPCYMINLFNTKQVDQMTFYKMLKELYPVESIANSDSTSLAVKSESTLARERHNVTGTFAKGLLTSGFTPDSNIPLKVNEQVGRSNLQLVSQEKERVNLLLISLIQQILATELEQYHYIDHVDFTHENSLVRKLFTRIMKSQETNVDTICCIVAHMMNSFLQQLQVDEIDSAAGQNRGDETGQQKQKKGKGLISNQALLGPNAIDNYFMFVKDLVESILSNQVLVKNTPFLHMKQSYRDEFKSRGQEEFPSLRLSVEIGLLIEILTQELQKFNAYKGNKEEQINQKILGLVFSMMRKVFKNYEQYLFPYLKSPKLATALEEGIARGGEQFENILDLFECYLTGNQAFKENGETHIMELNTKLQLLTQSTSSDLLEHVTQRNQVQQRLLSAKNFENLLLHSLSAQDYVLNLNTEVIYNLLRTLKKLKDQVAIIQPADTDPLFITLKDIKLSELSKTHKQQFLLKIKTRLLCDQRKPQTSRCPNCEVVLTPTYIAFENQPIFEQYEPEDKESLVSLYCEVLRQMPELKVNLNIETQIRKFTMTMKRSNKFAVTELVSKFLSVLDMEVTNTQSRMPMLVEDGIPQSDIFSRRLAQVADRQYFMTMQDDKERWKALAGLEVFDQLLKEAQEKINQRRRHISSLKILQERISKYLYKQLVLRLNKIRNEELLRYKIILLNMQLGLANHELRPLVNQSTQVVKMKAILAQQDAQKFSKSLFKVLLDKQKMNLRAISRKKAISLVNNGTITDIKLKSLQALIKDCVVIIMENEDRDVIIKLIFEQKSFSCFGGGSKKIVEQLLLVIQLEQKEILELRKSVRQFLQLCEYAALTKDSEDQIRKSFGKQFGSPSKNQSKSQSQKKSSKKKGNESKDNLLEQLQEHNNRVTYKNALEFDRSKLLLLINDMLRTRYAYIGNSLNAARGPAEMLKKQAQTD